MQNYWPSVPNQSDPNFVGNRYRLERSLGEGGFAEVFYAHDTHFTPHRPVALKLLYPQLLTDPQVCRDLQNEASALAAFNHPHILRVLDYQFSPAQAYLVTELAEGGSLDELLRPAGKPGRYLTLPQTLIYLEQLAAALDEAHRAGMIHRDIKPKNILLDRQGRVLLADFGLAMTINHSVALKTMQSVFGTPEYTAPEVWEDKVGKASDIYALGAVLFEMLAGVAPFQGSLPALLKQHLHDPVPRLADRQPTLDYPERLDDVLAQAMAKDPARRPRSASELFRLVRQIQLDANDPAANIKTRPSARPPYNYPPPGYNVHSTPNPDPNPNPAQAQPNRGAVIAQLPVGELLADLTAQIKATDPAGKWKKATRLGGTVLEHTYRHKDQYLKALNDLKGSIRPATSQAEMLLKRGQDFFGQHNFREALFDFTEGLQSNSPFKADLLYWRGMAYRAVKENASARQDFKRAVRMGHDGAKAALKDMPFDWYDALVSLERYILLWPFRLFGKPKNNKKKQP